MVLYSENTTVEIAQSLEELSEKKDYASMLPILEKLIQEDIGKVQLWKYRRYYRNLPDEFVDNSPAICSALSLLAILSGNTTLADKYMERLLKMQLRYRVKSQKYQEIENYIYCMEIASPHRNGGNVYRTLSSLVALIIKQGGKKIQLSLTANRPSIMNGGRDFSDYAVYIPKIRGVLNGFAKILYGSQGIGMVDLAIAEILYQHNKLYEALVLIVSAIPFIERQGDVSILFAAMALQFFILLANKQIESTKPMTETMREKILAAEAYYLLPNLNALVARAAMYDNDYNTIDHWFHNESPDEFGEFCTLDRFQYFVKLRCYLIYGKHLAAVALAERLRPILHDLNRKMELCELDMLLAISHYSDNDMKRAFYRLECSLKLAKKYRFDRIFADEGERLYLLLLDFEKDRGKSDYLTNVKELCYKTVLNFPNYLQKRQTLIEIPNEQESAMLILMEAGRSNAEISKLMGITINTVKYHSKNLYAKLGVNSRTQAIAAAKEQGFL